MGILTEMTGDSFASSDKKRENLQESVIAEGANVFDGNKNLSKYHGLGNLLESDNKKDQYMAGLTLKMLERVENLLEHSKETYGEAVVQANLGTLPKRVMDIVRKAG